MRKRAKLDSAASQRRLVLVLLLIGGGAFASCLNPRPEEVPGETAGPSEPGAADTIAAAPVDESADEAPAITAAPESAPLPDEADRRGSPDYSLPIEPELDAGADGGAALDAGVSVSAE